MILRFFSSAFLVLVSATLSLLLAEAVLKVHNPFGFRIKGDRVVLPANEAYRIKNDGLWGIDKVVTHSRNSLGFRGVEPHPDFRNALSIIAMGGSTTESFYQSTGKDWPSLAARRLSELFDNLWMNNAGLDGHSTYGHSVLLKDYVSQLKPKVVLFLVGANEISRGEENPFDLVFDYEIGTLWTGDVSGSIRRTGKYLAAQSELGALLLNLYRHYFATERGLNRYGSQAQNGHMYLKAGIKDLSGSEIAAIGERQAGSLLGFRNRLEQLIDFTVSMKALPVLITQPTLAGGGRDSVTSINLDLVAIDAYGESLNGRALAHLVELFNQVTRNTAKAKDVPLIDLAKLLPKNLDSYYDSFHFTNLGSQRTAAIIVERLCLVLDRRNIAKPINPCPSNTSFPNR